MLNAVRIVVIGLAILDFMLFVIAIGLAGNNKRGFYLQTIEGSEFVSTSNVEASFAFVGTALGIILTLWILVMGSIDNWNRDTIVAWVFVGGLMLWFICGAIGMWCFQISAENVVLPQLFVVEFGFEVASSVIFLIIMALVVSRVSARKEIAK